MYITISRFEISVNLALAMDVFDTLGNIQDNVEDGTKLVPIDPEGIADGNIFDEWVFLHRLNSLF